MRLSPGGTANGEGGEGPPAGGAAGEPMAPTRSWVKEPWKAEEGMSGKSAAARVNGPGLVSAKEAAVAPEAKKDSTAERGGSESAGCGGVQRAPSPPPAEASCAAMRRERWWAEHLRRVFLRGLWGTKDTASPRL